MQIGVIWLLLKHCKFSCEIHFLHLRSFISSILHCTIMLGFHRLGNILYVFLILLLIVPVLSNWWVLPFNNNITYHPIPDTHTHIHTYMYNTYSMYIHTSFSTSLHFFLAPSLEKTEDFLRFMLTDRCDDCDSLAAGGALYLCTRRNAATYN